MEVAEVKAEEGQEKQEEEGVTGQIEEEEKKGVGKTLI
jgi:hypothetical protein